MNIYGNYIEESYRPNNITYTCDIVNSINEICESTVCSLEPLDEEYVVVNEIFFSKKDLQNPDTLKKLLDKAQKEKDIKKKLDDVFMCLTFVEAILGSIGVGVLTKSIFKGIASFLPLMIATVTLTFKVCSAMDTAMYAIHEARIKKLLKKATELRDKAKAAGQNDIANNCQKVIDTIEKHYKDEATKKFRKRVDEIKKYYKSLVNIINGKEGMGSPDLTYFVLADLLKIPHKRIDDGMRKEEIDNSAFEYFYGTDSVEDAQKEYGEDLNKIIQYIPEFKTGAGIVIYYAIDDTVFCYSPRSKYFGYGGYKAEWMNFNKEIYPLIKSIDNSEIDPKDKNDIEALKVADAELGYYRLSPAPEGVTPKKI